MGCEPAERCESDESYHQSINPRISSQNNGGSKAPRPLVLRRNAHISRVVDVKLRALLERMNSNQQSNQEAKMQIKYLPKPLYQLAKIAQNTANLNPIVSKRCVSLERWEKYKEKGLNMKELQEITGISQATYYRYKKSLKRLGIKGLIPQSTRPHNLRRSKINQNIKQIIFKIRSENPTYGKAAIYKIMERDHEIKISESTVGRVITRAIRLGQIKKIIYGKTNKKPRIFDKYAQRSSSELRKKALGSVGKMIQIDHMSVTSPHGGATLKHFTAYDRTSKFAVHEIYSRASSSCAASFLEKALQEFPFPILSIQVDGGSEFMKDFEAICEEKKIPLYVLPPRSPKLNGGVERCNKTSRHEFYQYYEGVYTVSAIRPALKRYMDHYNTFRPHRAIDLQTPFDYYNSISKEVA